MKNYNELLKNVKTLDEMEVILEAHSNDILDNVECILDETKVQQALKVFNDEYEYRFIDSFLYKLGTDRKTAFESLIEKPSFTKLDYVVNENGSYTIKTDGLSVFKFEKLEKAYQKLHSVETDKNGKAIPNKGVTIFGALRYKALCETFIRNMFIGNVCIDTDSRIDLSRITLDNDTVFSENDGKCFSSGSNTSLEKQLNILVKFFGLDVKMLKRDIAPLKMAVQKLKKDTNNKLSIKEMPVLKFTDILFSVVTSRYNNEDVKIFTADGKEVAEKVEA